MRRRARGRTVTLDTLPVGASAAVAAVGGEASFRRRLLELGFTPGTVIVRVGQAPMGDPLTFRLRNALVALRASDAMCVRLSAPGV